MKQSVLISLCLVFGLLLAACGDGGQGAAEAPATPTAIVEVAPADTPTVETEATGESEDITGTEEITGTEGLTDTEEMTGTEDITDTEEMTGTEGITGTEEMTGTDDGAGVTATPTVTATEELTETETISPGVSGTQGMTGTDVAATGIRGVLRASELLDYDVENLEGEDLGSLNDIVVSLDQGCMDYLILSFGGILGLGSSEYLIPWRAVQIDPINGRVLLNIDQEVLNDAPALDPNMMPDMTTDDWDAPYTGFWDTVTYNPPADLGLGTVMTDTTGADDATQPCGQMATTDAGVAAGSAVTDTTATGDTGIAVGTPRAIRISDLLGYNIHNPAGEDVGELEDIMVDWRRDQLAYAILSFGGFLGLGENWYVIPLDQLTLDPLENRLIADIDPDRLAEAPGFGPDDLPDTADPNWDAQIREYWRQIQ